LFILEHMKSIPGYLKELLKLLIQMTELNFLMQIGAVLEHGYKLIIPTFCFSSFNLDSDVTHCFPLNFVLFS
jgi:hypothetical protein